MTTTFWQEHGDLAHFFDPKRMGLLKQRAAILDAIIEHCRSTNRTPNQLRLLDAGCNGSKEYEQYKIFDYWGCDITPKCIELSKMRHRELSHRLQVLSVENMHDYLDESFDFVVCKGVLQHCEYFEKGIIECLRVCRPSGVAIFSFGYELTEREEVIRQVNKPPVHDNIYDIRNLYKFLNGLDNIYAYETVTIDEGVTTVDGHSKNTFISVWKKS